MLHQELQGTDLTAFESHGYNKGDDDDVDDDDDVQFARVRQ